VLLGYNTNGLVHHRLDEALRLLADMGFSAVALTPDVGHLDPFRSSPAEVDRIARLLTDLGLFCVVESGARFILDPTRKHYPTLVDADPEARAVRRNYLERCLDLARDLGAGALSFWSGAADSGPEAARTRLTDEIARLLDHSATVGVPIAFEPEPGMLVETVAEAVAVLEALDRPDNFGLTVDIGHLYVTGEGTPLEILPPVANHILQVHLEDMKRGVHEHLPPGEGDVDFSDVWAGLAAADYQGPVCFELSRSSHAAVEMLARVKQLFDAR